MFTTNIPVVIGYGGNDGALLSVLDEGRVDLQQGMYWCYLRRDGRPRPEILDFIGRRGGWLVPIDGFDELMIRLQDTLGLELLDSFLKRRGDDRAARYLECREMFGRVLAEGARAEAAPVEGLPGGEGAREETAAAERGPIEAAGQAVEGESTDAPRSLQMVSTRAVSGRTPQEWDSLAMLEPNSIKRARIYEDGLRTLPESAWMAVYAALFFETTSATERRAEDLYLRSIDLAESDSGVLTNYANFLTDIRQDHDAAETLYERALEVDPTRVSTLGNYANFLRNVRRNHEQAEALYRRVLEIDPNRPSTLGNYALLLAEDRQDYDAAEVLYKRALEASPNHANHLINYANFLTDVRQDYATAEALYKRALEAAPDNADRLRDYANFLANVRQDYAAAGVLYKRAQEIDPDEVNELGF